MRVPADPALGQRIMRRRQALDMSQEKLARLIDVSRDTVSNWETGKHFPKRKLGRLEEVLGISLDGRDELKLSPEVRAVIDSLSDGERELVMTELRAADRRLSGRSGDARRPGAHRKAG